MAEANTAEAEAKVDAAFGAAFTGVPEDAPPAPAAKVVEETPVEPAKEPAAVVAPVVVPEKPQYVRITKQDWDNAKASILKVSSLEGQVAKLTGNVSGAQKTAQEVLDTIRAQTPVGLNVEITDDDFAEMAENFGPEMAGLTRAGMKKIFSRLNLRGTAPAPTTPTTAPATPPAPPVDVNAAVERVLADRELNALKKTYPDWSDIVGRPPIPGDPIPENNPFRQWLAKQPADYQKEINETDSPAEVQGAISRFRADSARTTSAPAKPDKAAARRAVLEDAVTAKADGSPPPLNQPVTAEEAFLSAGRAFRAKR